MSAKQRPILTLCDILSIEDDRSLLEFRCRETGILLWPLVRVPFFRAVMSDILYDTPLPLGRAKIAGFKLKAVSTIGKAVAHNTFYKNSLKADILLMATGTGNQIKDGRWFNRLSDYFALAREDQTLLVEDSFNWQWPFPRHNARVLLNAPTQVAAAVVGRSICRTSHLDQARHLISLVAQRSRKLLDWELGAGRTEKLTSFLARKSAAVPWIYRSCQSLLERTQPKLLIKEEACYGPSAVLIYVAKEMGIVTAEFQHGAISVGHDAYNFSSVMRNAPDYRQTLPDYFLGYGEWWNDQINVPVNKIAIGNPHRSEQLKKHAAQLQQERTDILILSDGVEPRLYLDLAQRLAAQLKNKFSIVFRPHPLDRAKVQEQFPENRAGAVRIDVNTDIYQSFLSSYAVVSELSTGLFEAVGLVKRIFIWDTPKARFCFPTHPFNAFADAEDLVSQLSGENNSELTEEQAAGIWEPDWRKNYQNFLTAIGLKQERRINE